jgi:hypothetical protein
VILQKMSMASRKPGGLAWTDPRASISLTDAMMEGKVSRVTYERPNEKPLRLNIQRVWREEGQEFVRRLGGGFAPTSWARAQLRSHRRREGSVRLAASLGV